MSCTRLDQLGTVIGTDGAPAAKFTIRCCDKLSIHQSVVLQNTAARHAFCRFIVRSWNGHLGVRSGMP